MHPTTLTSEAFLATAFLAASVVLVAEGLFLGDHAHHVSRTADTLIPHAQTAAMRVGTPGTRLLPQPGERESDKAALPVADRD